LDDAPYGVGVGLLKKACKSLPSTNFSFYAIVGKFLGTEADKRDMPYPWLIKARLAWLRGAGIGRSFIVARFPKSEQLLSDYRPALVIRTRHSLGVSFVQRRKARDRALECA
jgi:hypothetical protein